MWDKYPEQRLGQLLENYVFTSGERGDRTSRAMFYQEDEDTLENLGGEKEEEGVKEVREVMEDYEI